MELVKQVSIKMNKPRIDNMVNDKTNLQESPQINGLNRGFNVAKVSIEEENVSVRLTTRNEVLGFYLYAIAVSFIYSLQVSINRAIY